MFDTARGLPVLHFLFRIKRGQSLVLTEQGLHFCRHFLGIKYQIKIFGALFGITDLAWDRVNHGKVFIRSYRIKSILGAAPLVLIENAATLRMQLIAHLMLLGSQCQIIIIATDLQVN